MLSLYSSIPRILRPVLLLAAICALLLVSGGCRRRRTTPLHEAGLLVFWSYLAALCWATVNTIRVLRGNFAPGSSYNLTPLAGIADVVSGGDMPYILLNIPGNVLLFLPLGLLLPLLWRGWTGLRVLLASLLLSGSIEVLQFFTGRSADIDDVLLNTIGGIVGFCCYHAVRVLHPAMAARFHLRAAAPARRNADPAEQRPRGQNRSGRAVHRGAAFATTAVALCMIIIGAALLGGAGQVPATVPRGTHPTALRQLESTAEPPIYFELPGINSTHVLLMSADTRQVLYEKQADRRIYPASLTKIMTAVLALEHIEDLAESFHLRDGLFVGIQASNAATAGFLPGEEVRALDLLYGLLLPSGAECAVGLAEHIAGSEESFADLMNAKAWQLGMDGTHFVNATGLHHKDHYTTVADLALLLRYALQNETFYTIFTAERHSTAPTNLHPDGITFYSTLFSRAGTAAFPGGVLLGGKTGYTDEAGQCLASLAQVNGERHFLITAGAYPADFRTQNLHIEDALVLYGALHNGTSYPSVL